MMEITSYHLKLSSTAVDLGELIMEKIFPAGFEVRELSDGSFLFIGYSAAPLSEDKRGKESFRKASPAEKTEKTWRRLLDMLKHYSSDLLNSGGYLLRKEQDLEVDWVKNFQENYREFYPAPGWVVLPPWRLEKFNRTRESSSSLKKIIIEPGIAFGTGTHASTALALKALTDVIGVSGADFSAEITSLLDVGCGSGILSLAAARLGIKQITALDRDPEATANTRHNLSLNQALRKNSSFTIITADIRDYASEYSGPGYSLIVANCLAGILREILPQLAELLAQDGRLVISGFQSFQEADIRSCLRREKLKVISRSQQEGWLAFILKNS